METSKEISTEDVKQTLDELDKFMKDNPRRAGDISRPRVVCNDGFKMSVQFDVCDYLRSDSFLLGWKPHSILYAEMIDDDGDVTSIKNYKTVEVGYPTDKPICFSKYAEDNDDYTETVYGYVPIELVCKEIIQHNGIKEAQYPIRT